MVCLYGAEAGGRDTEKSTFIRRRRLTQKRKIFFSEEFRLEDRMEMLGVFDPIINADSNYFINIKRLRETNVPEFENSYEKINKYFSDIGKLLLAANGDANHKAYKTATKMFDFSEVDGINLGTSTGKPGKGFGEKLREQIIKDASEIILTCSNQPEIFHLLSLFEDNVGSDRISDMIATLVYDEIMAYTKRIYSELEITYERYSKYNFKDGIIFNPYKKNKELLLVPVNILHEMPIAKDWDDIDRVCSENKAIKEEINEMVRLEWYKMTTGQKKHEIKRQIFLNDKSLNKIVEAYNNSTLDECDIMGDSEYFIEKIAHKYREHYPVMLSSNKDTYEASIEICNHFKRLIEECKGYELLYNGEIARDEKTVQKALHMTAYYYCLANNPDLSPEPNAGRGPVDFKISRGNDKTVIEIKLTSNKDTVHGFETQIEEYAKAENTDKKVFLMIENGHEIRAGKVFKLHEEKVKNGEKPATVICIDAKYKDSASKYVKLNSTK